MTLFDQKLAAALEWFKLPRFDGIVRLYGPREIAEQQGTIDNDYTVARTAAEQFHARLRELFGQKKSITTFGPYSPGPTDTGGIWAVWVTRRTGCGEALAAAGCTERATGD